MRQAALTIPLTATIEPAESGPGGVYAVTLRVTNVADVDVEILNPDMGRPPEQMHWPYSQSAYRMSLLLSFGFLTVTLVDGYGEQVREEPLETWATPVLSAPLRLSSGDGFDVHVPLGEFFPLTPGERYRLSLVYGDRSLRVRAGRDIAVPGI